MSSRREAIMLAVVAALNGVEKPAGLSVHRMRTRPIHKDVLPALVVYLGPESVARGDGAFGYKNRRNQTVRVEVRMVVPPGVSPDTALDPLTSYVEQRLMLDYTFGGVARNTQVTAIDWDANDETDAHYAAAAMDFTIEYLTAAGDPDVA